MLHINNACIAFGAEVLFRFQYEAGKGRNGLHCRSIRLWKDFVAECGNGVCAFERGIYTGRGNIA